MLKHMDSGYHLVALALVVALVAVCAVGYTAVAGQTQHMRTISITATGTASASPSAVMVYLIANATGYTAESANANLSAIVGTLNTTLYPLINGNLSMIQTQSYSIYQPTECIYQKNCSGYYCQCTTVTLPYYAATEGLSVRIPNIANTPDAISGISAIQGLQLQNIEARLSDSQTAALNQQALYTALNNATGQASLLAGGSKLVVENITTQYNNVYYPTAYYEAMSSRSNSPSTYFGGSISVLKGVRIVFSMH